MKSNLLHAWLLVATFIGMSANADDGHDHGAAPAAAAAPALPRFVSSSELFELVGVANGRFISLYLDRFVDNEPVRKATIGLEVGGTRVAVKEVAPGEYEGELAARLEPGLIAVTATVSVGSDTDLLAGDLIVPAAAAVGPAASDWKRAAWGAGALALLAAIGLAVRRSAAGCARAGGAA